MNSNRHQQQKRLEDYSKPCLQNIGNLGDLTSGGSGKKRESGKKKNKESRARSWSALVCFSIDRLPIPDPDQTWLFLVFHPDKTTGVIVTPTNRAQSGKRLGGSEYMAAHKANPTATTAENTHNIPTKLDRSKMAIHPLKNIIPLRMNMIWNAICI